jgi:hypothetical protein
MDGYSFTVAVGKDKNRKNQNDAFLIVLPAWVYGLQTGTLALALTGLPIFVFLIALSLGKLACPACGKAMRTIGTKLTNCPHCGTPYATKS